MFDSYSDAGQAGPMMPGGMSPGKSYFYHSSLIYPSPFQTIVSKFLPKTQKELLHQCRWYARNHSVISPILHNLSSYAVGQIIVEEADPFFKKDWENIIQTIGLRPFYIDANLDTNTFGNCFVYIHFPFDKYLECKNCKNTKHVSQTDYRFKNFEFEINCKKCGAIWGKTHPIDVPKKSLKGIRLMRVPPELMDIEYNPLTGDADYYMTLPRITRNEVIMGKKHIIETLPQTYIDSMKQGKRVKFTQGSLYHFKRPSTSDSTLYGWGEPLIQPVLTDAAYLQILRKAQEAILYGCLVPLRIVFPQAGDATSSPYQNVNLARWTNTIKTELIKWRRDPNHMPIVPMPVGSQLVAGDAKALTLFQELEIQAEQIATGCGVPIELYKGGLSWSGSNMSLRLLENKFLNQRESLYEFSQKFLLPKIAAFLGKNVPTISFTKFKMADDLQRTALDFQLWQSQLLSATTVLAGMDHDYIKEKELIAKEQGDQVTMQKRMQLSNAQIQGEMSVLQAKYQAQAQKKMQQMMLPAIMPQGNGQQQQTPDASQQMNDMNLQAKEGPDKYNTGMDAIQIGSQVAAEIGKLAPQEQTQAMSELRMSNPELYKIVTEKMNSDKGSNFNPMANALPQNKPPRSPNATI
jgi:hypothetical protein